MPFPPQIRRTALTLHVAVSVGWLGGVGAFLALAVAGLGFTTPGPVDAGLVVLGRAVLLPLALGALVTGVVQSFGSPWGLLRHYWVLFKLVITVLATLLLVVHLRVVDQVAVAPAGAEVGALRVQLVVDAAAAVVVLLLATVLSVFKPRGETGVGRRRRATSQGDEQASSG
jgi:hypothetical protein